VPSPKRYVRVELNGPLHTLSRSSIAIQQHAAGTHKMLVAETSHVHRATDVKLRHARDDDLRACLHSGDKRGSVVLASPEGGHCARRRGVCGRSRFSDGAKQDGESRNPDGHNVSELPDESSLMSMPLNMAQEADIYGLTGLHLVDHETQAGAGGPCVKGLLGRCAHSRPARHQASEESRLYRKRICFTRSTSSSESREPWDHHGVHRRHRVKDRREREGSHALAPSSTARAWFSVTMSN
jgi:hypothetical protein